MIAHRVSDANGSVAQRFLKGDVMPSAKRRVRVFLVERSDSNKSSVAEDVDSLLAGMRGLMPDLKRSGATMKISTRLLRKSRQ